MKYDLSVVAPCYNEAGNIPELVSRLLAAFERKNINGQIVLVNDASTDNTGVVIDRFAEQHQQVKGVHHPSNRGIEGGWASGASASEGRYVCFMDADLQNLPEDVPRLYREILQSRADVVQGTRSTIGRLKDSRFTLSKGLNIILNTAFGMNLKDNKSGFVIALRDTMLDILRHRYHYQYFQSFITVAAKAKGYSVREVETLFESRLVGKSFISFPGKVIAGVLVDVAKAVLEYRLNVKQEDILRDFLQEHRPQQKDAPLTGWRKWTFDAFFATMPLHKWMITGRAKHYYHELKESQWLTPADVKRLQERKLRKMIHHAYHHVAYYRDRMDQLGLKPTDIRTIEDLPKLPLLTKADVRQNLFFDLFSDNHDKRKILRINTSGSTGEPFVTYADAHQLEIRWATTLRAMEWAGYRWGDRQVRLWHQTIGMSKTQVIREYIDALFSRRIFIPAYEMKDKNMDEVIEKMKAHDPALIDGYAESLNFLAHYLRNNQVSGFESLRGVISSAQVLPDQSRDTIEKSFGCGVFDKYGSREFSGIAYECDAHEGHHICAESYIVEILKDGRPAEPGEMGEIVITDLNNACVPLIRYRIGDLAVAIDNTVACPCGRGLPRIGKIEGRVQAIIFAANGTFLPGTFFAHLFKDYEYLIRQYQVLQETKGEIRLKIIKGARYTESGFDEVLTKLREFLGHETKIHVEYVEEIAMVRTGKHQGSISKLSIDFQELDSAPDDTPIH